MKSPISISLIGAFALTALFASACQKSNSTGPISQVELVSAKDKPPKKDKEKEPPKSDKPPNTGPENAQGGAGVNVPTVHGCTSKDCWNNGPMEPTPPPKKCRKEKGIEICD